MYAAPHLKSIQVSVKFSAAVLYIALDSHD